MEETENSKPIEETKEIESEIIEDLEPWYKGPIKYILAIFLILILTLWYIPNYAIKLDPSPSKIPQISEVLPNNIVLENTTVQINNKEDFVKLVNPKDPVIKQTANKISSISCEGNKICHAKAIYYFVRNNFDYISDPVNQEYIEDPKEFLTSGGGDCESGTILLSALLESIGISTELVFIPNHAFLRINLPEASRRYKINEHVYLDWTCENCEFGEIPLSNRKFIS